MLSDGALVGAGRYKILQMTQPGQWVNRYQVEGQPILLCPNPDCRAENAPNAVYCERCGHDMAEATPFSPRYSTKQTHAPDALRAEMDIARMNLTHPHLILPREAFAEITGGARHYYVVLDEPLWTTAAQTTSVQELTTVLRWGIGLADGLAYLHGQRIVMQEVDSRQVALMTKAAYWADFSTARVIAPDENSTQLIANDVRQLAALLYRLATGLTQYDPGVKLAAPKANVMFARALSETGYASADEFAAALREVETSVRHPGGMDVHVARLSDVGRQRDLDEDSVLTLELGQVYRSVSTPIGVYAVADGMGGHESGDVASRLAIRAIGQRALIDIMAPALVDNAPPVDVEAWLKSVIEEANLAVLQQRTTSHNDMGTTLVMAAVVGSEATIAHVGDSRAYLIRQGKMEPLTTDHSLVARLVATGQITPEEAAVHPQRNVIYKSLGDKPRVEPDLKRLTLNPDDVLLLCCDGLTGELDDAAILSIVRASSSLPEAARQLIYAANEAGGSDNISAVLIGVQAAG